VEALFGLSAVRLRSETSRYLPTWPLGSGEELDRASSNSTSLETKVSGALTG